MKKALKALLVAFLAIAVLAAGGFFYIKSLPVPTVEVKNVSLDTIQDGSYIGQYDTKLVKATVEVTVADHRINTIRIIKHECGLGKKAERITEDIIKAQSLKVDTVSGATQSSNVILKAVENALEKGVL